MNDEAITDRYLFDRVVTGTVIETSKYGAIVQLPDGEKGIIPEDHLLHNGLSASMFQGGERFKIVSRIKYQSGRGLCQETINGFLAFFIWYPGKFIERFVEDYQIMPLMPDDQRREPGSIVRRTDYRWYMEGHGTFYEFDMMHFPDGLLNVKKGDSVSVILYNLHTDQFDEVVFEVRSMFEVGDSTTIRGHILDIDGYFAIEIHYYHYRPLESRILVFASAPPDYSVIELLGPPDNDLTSENKKEDYNGERQMKKENTDRSVIKLDTKRSVTRAFETIVIKNEVLVTASVSCPDDYVIENGKLIEYRGLGGDVVIPENVTSIGDSVFEWWISLTSIALPKNVTSIGVGAFHGCKYLTSINLPEGVTSIGHSAFRGCKGLADSDGFVIVGGQLFDYYGPDGDVVVPNGVTSVGKEAFQYCSSLTSINLPKSVTSIGDWAFQDCTSLTSITLPDGVTSIEDGTFYQCKSLMGITLPDSVTKIGNGAFYNCENLTSITLPYGVTSIGNNAFSDCESLTSIDLPESVASIGCGAFSSCRSLTSIVLPKGLTRIENYTFFFGMLTSLTLPESLTSIGEEAFAHCDFSDVTIPEGLTSIGEQAFKCCFSLTSITFPSSLSRIGKEAFIGCNLKSICLPQEKDRDWLNEIDPTGELANIYDRISH